MKMDEVVLLTKSAIKKGLIEAERTSEGINLNITEQFVEELNNTACGYYLNLLNKFSRGAIDYKYYVLSKQIIPYVFPLDVEVTFPQGSIMGKIAAGAPLYLPWSLTLYDMMRKLYSTIALEIGVKYPNIQIRRILPVELGGYYANEAPGPFGKNSKSKIKELGEVRVKLSKGINKDVVNIDLTKFPPKFPAEIANSMLILIYSIINTTAIPHATGFMFVKNGKPMIPKGPSGAYPMLWIDWKVKKVTEVGLLPPILLKRGDTFNVHVYSTESYDEEMLMFDGFIGYITTSRLER